MTGARDDTGAAADLAGAPRPGTGAVAFQELSRIHETERRAVASALHDRIGQALSAIKMSVHLVIEEPDATQRREDLAEVMGMADAAVAELRVLESTLFPPHLRSLGLVAALQGEAERQQSGTPCMVSLDLGRLDARLDRDLEIACFRICQQLLRHALGPAKARNAVILLRMERDQRLLLEVAHDGEGFVSSDPALALLRARAQECGGAFASGPRAPWPCSSRVDLPLAAPGTCK